MGSLFDKPMQETGSSTSTNNPYQQEYYDKLLEGAAGWLENGGMGQGENYLGNMKDILTQTGQGYMDMVSGAGTQDRYDALQDMNAASAAQAANALGGEMNAIGLGASGSGTSNSSRRGVAEGVATAGANRDLASQQAAQNQAFINNEQSIKQQGMQGLGGMFGQLGNLQGFADASTSGAKDLQNLLAFQNLISGNMGGTTTGTQMQAGNSMFDNILGAASVGAGFMSDKRLKKKIKTVKTRKGKPVKTPKGVTVKEWEWNDKAEDEYGLSGKAKGVIAQEAEKKVPKSVQKDKKGMRKVNYGALM